MTFRAVVSSLVATLALVASAARAGDPAVALDPAFNASTADVLSTGAIRHVANLDYMPGTNDGGSDLEFTRINGRDYAIAGRLSNNPWVIDITDPENPSKVSEIPCRLNQNDVQVRGTLVILAADGRGTCAGFPQFIGFAVVSLANPSSPQVLGTATIGRGAHNVTLHPTEPLVYVSDSDLAGVGVLHIWDVSDPTKPLLVKAPIVSPLHSSHDITFNADGTRAYSAALTHTDIFDTTDPRNPVLIATIMDAAINIHHQADPTPDGRYLIISDELAGAITGPVCPGGGLHVYDILVDRAPVKVGVFYADPIGRASVCTSHVFRINPDGNSMAIAWYNAGVHVFDISSLAKIGVAGSGTTGLGVRTIASMKLPNADTWAAKMWQERHPGYVFSNDMGRGFDVFYVPELG